jgi:nucleoside 2-deoxyribosyltransferase
MKFYLAGAFHSRDTYRELSEYLEDMGFISTARWLYMEHSISDAKDMPRLGAEFAGHDRDDVFNADVLILHTNAPTDPYTSGGRHVEFGLALAWEKPIIIFDPYQDERIRDAYGNNGAGTGTKMRENVFHWYDRDVYFYGTYVPAVVIVSNREDLVDKLVYYESRLPSSPVLFGAVPQLKDVLTIV